MSVDWNEVKKALYPIKAYEDLSQRLHGPFAYAFVRETFDATMPELAGYTQRVLGEDLRGRYTEYATMLINVFSALHQAGVVETYRSVKQTLLLAFDWVQYFFSSAIHGPQKRSEN